MNIVRIDHIAIAVNDAKQIAAKWCELFGLKIEYEEMLSENGVKVELLKIANVHSNNSKIELIEPLNENSPIKKFLEKRGNAIHHICFETLDIEADIEELKKAGIGLIDEKPRKGSDDNLIAFIKPKDTNGILIELKQSNINFNSSGTKK